MCFPSFIPSLPHPAPPAAVLVFLQRIVVDLFRLVNVVRGDSETADKAFNVRRTLSAWHNPIQVDSVTAILFSRLDDVVLHNVSLSSFCNNRTEAARLSDNILSLGMSDASEANFTASAKISIVFI